MSVVAGNKIYVEIGARKFEISSCKTDVLKGIFEISCSSSVMSVFDRWFDIIHGYKDSEDFDKTVIYKDIIIGDSKYHNCLVSSCKLLSDKNDWCQVILTFDYLENLAPTPGIDRKLANEMMKNLFGE